MGRQLTDQEIIQVSGGEDNLDVYGSQIKPFDFALKARN